MAGGRFKSLVRFGGHETNYPSCYYLDRFVWDQRSLADLLAEQLSCYR